MNLKTTKLDFSDQVFTIGIDVHKKNWNITIRSNAVHLKTFNMNDPLPVKLYEHMQKNYPGGTYYSVYESGFCGYWIHRELEKFGFRNIITNAADVPTSHKEKDRKSDSIDSSKLCRELENGSLAGIYVLTPYQEALRALSRLLRQYLKRNTQVKTRIKSFLDYLGIKTPEELSRSNWSRNYLAWLAKIEFKEKHNRLILNEHIEELEHIRLKRLKLLKQIRVISLTIPVLKYLRTIPGLGQITAFTLYTELIDIKRFGSFDCLASYVGLVPSISSSDEKVNVNGITQRHNKHLRYILIEAAWIAVRCDPAMTLAYNNLCKRMKKSRAVIQIAKKLLNRIRYVWLHQKEYVTALVESK